MRGRLTDYQNLLAHFHVSGEQFALPVPLILEIVFVTELIVTPHRPPFVDGILDLGGTAVPVLNTARLLGLKEEEEGLYAHVVLLRQGFGLRVDAVERLLPRKEGSARAVPPELSFNRCVEAYLQYGDTTLCLLNQEHLLLLEEQERLAQFARLENARLRQLDGHHD